MSTDQIGSPRSFTTETPDQPTHPTSVGSAMTLVLDQEDASRKRTPAPADAKAQREAAARRLAAGPYLHEPETLPITWFAQPHPAPWMRWVYVTAEIADYLLREHNTDNRPLRPSRVDYYRKIMTNRRTPWRLTHQGVAMDTNAVLQDGQHRLAAIVAAAAELHDDDFRIAVPFFVGMAPENFAAIDENLNRSPMDLFAKGGVKYGSAITTSIRLILAFSDKTPRRLIRERQPNEVILSFYADNDTELLQRAATFGCSHYRKVGNSQGALAALHYLLHTACGTDNAYVTAFLDGLVTGRKSGTRMVLEDDDPRQVARNYFRRVRDERKRLVGIDALSIMVIAWNNVVQGLRPRYVRFLADAAIPQILICHDAGPHRSAVPSVLRGEIDQ